MCCLLLATGCSLPRTTITSTPAGAECYIDGQRRGTTPVEDQFRWSGLRRIEVVKETHRRRAITTDLRPSPPGWLFPLDFPWDLGRYLFLPRQRRLGFILEPAVEEAVEPPDRTEVLRFCRRAEELAARRIP